MKIRTSIVKVIITVMAVLLLIITVKTNAKINSKCTVETRYLKGYRFTLARITNYLEEKEARPSIMLIFVS